MGFFKGQEVFRWYTCEPAFIYGSGKSKEKGVVIGEPVKCNEHQWIPVKWEFSGFPELSLLDNVHVLDE